MGRGKRVCPLPYQEGKLRVRSHSRGAMFVNKIKSKDSHFKLMSGLRMLLGIGFRYAHKTSAEFVFLVELVFEP